MWKIKKIQIPIDSDLQIISKHAFKYSAIESISIPSNLKEIQDEAFSNCQYLSKFKIPNISKLKHIGKCALSECVELKQFNFPSNSKSITIDNEILSDSSIENISIPSNINFNSRWFYKTHITSICIQPFKEKNISIYANKFILGKSNQFNPNFDVLVFAYQDIKIANIPSFITKIENYSFYNCNFLKKVIIPDDSQLQKIGKYAFCHSSTVYFSIPPQITHINESMFNNCTKLTKIEIKENSELRSIGKNAFKYTKISSLFIPSVIKEINSKTFYGCSNLRIIEIGNSQLKSRISIIFKFINYREELIIYISN